MKVTLMPERAQDTYRVESNSGNVYEVEYRGFGDGDPDVVRLWNCTCPAGQYGRMCKHIKAVIAKIEEDEG